MTCFIKCPLPNQGWLMSLSCILPVDLQDCQLPNLQRTLSWTWRISAWEIFLLMLIGVRLDNQLRAMQIESLDTTLLPSSSYELLTCSLYWMKCLQLEPLSPMRMICSAQSDKFPANLRVLYWNDPVHYIGLQYITLHLKAKLPCWTLVSFITAAHPGSLIPASQMYGFYICIASYHQPTAWAGQLQPTSHLPTQADQPGPPVNQPDNKLPPATYKVSKSHIILWWDCRAINHWTSVTSPESHARHHYHPHQPCHPPQYSTHCLDSPP